MIEHETKMARVTVYGFESEYDRGGVEAAILYGLEQSAKSGSGRVESVRELRLEVLNAGPADFSYFSTRVQSLIVKSVCRELVGAGKIRPCYTVGKRRPEVHGFYLVTEEVLAEDRRRGELDRAADNDIEPQELKPRGGGY